MKLLCLAGMFLGLMAAFFSLPSVFHGELRAMAQCALVLFLSGLCFGMLVSHYIHEERRDGYLDWKKDQEIFPQGNKRRRG
jgi:hypothetical protein